MHSSALISLKAKHTVCAMCICLKVYYNTFLIEVFFVLFFVLFYYFLWLQNPIKLYCICAYLLNRKWYVAANRCR